MFFVYTILLLAGALPFTVFLMKRTRYRRILREGISTTAQVTQVRRISMNKGPVYDQVFYAYLPAGSIQYQSGMHKYSAGKFRSGDTFEIFYLAEKPSKHAIPGSKGETAFLIFTILFFLFIIYACFKISEMAG